MDGMCAMCNGRCPEIHAQNTAVNTAVFHCEYRGNTAVLLIWAAAHGDRTARLPRRNLWIRRYSRRYYGGIHGGKSVGVTELRRIRRYSPYCS